MRACLTVRAALTLALALAATPVRWACAEPPGRSWLRVEDRGQGRAPTIPRTSREGGGQPAYAAPAHAPPAYASSPAYAYPPRPAAPYGPPAYGQPTYGPAARPGYAPNSLGAGWGQQQDAARRGVRQGALSLGQVMANIRRGTPGKLLDAGLEPGPGGRPVYRVRWAAVNGRRIDFIVDAATGAIIGRSGY